MDAVDWTFVAGGMGVVLLLMFMMWQRSVMEKPKESPVLDRKARFKLYVQGEQQLMADWEAAFDPIRAETKALRDEFKRTMHPLDIPGDQFTIYDEVRYDEWRKKKRQEVRVPGGSKAGPFDGPAFDAYSNPYLTVGDYMRGGPHA